VEVRVKSAFHVNILKRGYQPWSVQYSHTKNIWCIEFLRSADEEQKTAIIGGFLFTALSKLCENLSQEPI